MIAMRTALAESDATSQFTQKIASLVEDLAKSGDPKQAAMAQAILDNHAQIILERQRIGMFAATAQVSKSNAG